MRTRISTIFLGILMVLGSATAKAQYYEIANQIPQLIAPALQGGFNYKGFVEGGYIGFVGDKKASVFDISTVQGFRYSNWFFMGVGAGINILTSNPNDDWGSGWGGNTYYNEYINHSDIRTAVMIPLFTDFRFNIGNDAKGAVSFFIDLRLGGSFLVGNDWVRIGNGYLTRSQCFYLKPSIGLRIPVSDSNVKQAINIGVSYMLLTQDYWNSYSNSAVLNGVGATISFEW